MSSLSRTSSASHLISSGFTRISSASRMIASIALFTSGKPLNSIVNAAGWLGVSHGRNHGEAVACVGHVQVRDQHVKFLGGNAFQSVRYTAYCHDLESLEFERFAHHVPYRIVVIN